MKADTVARGPSASGKSTKHRADKEISKNASSVQHDKAVALNFRVPAEMKKNFKIMAATHGITQSELLIQAFTEWIAKRN